MVVKIFQDQPEFVGPGNQTCMKLDLMFMKHYAPNRCLYIKVAKIKNWSGECRDVIPTKLRCQAIQRALQSPNLQREIIRKK